MTGNVHFFTNNESFRMSINEKKKTELNSQNLFKYNPMQYPFIGEGDNTKKIKVDTEEERESLLIKRDDQDFGIYHSELEPEPTKHRELSFPPTWAPELVIFFFPTKILIKI